MHTPTTAAEPSHLSTGLASAAWRHRRLVALLALLGLVLGIAAVSLRAPRYEATARLLMFESPEATLFGTQGGSDPFRRMQNSIERLRDDALLTRATERAGSALTATELRRNLDVRVSDVSDTILVTVTHREPDVATRLADGVAEALAESLRETADARAIQAREELAPLLTQLQQMIDEGQAALDGVTSPEARSDIEARRSLALVDLHDMTMAAERLRVDTALFNGGVGSVQPATVPTSPASADLGFGAAVGLLLGLVLGGLLAWWRAERDPQVAAANDPELIAGIPLLGELPVPKKGGVLTHVTPASREILGALRFRAPFEDGQRLLCSAMRPFPGRSHLTVQLAAAAASAGQRVAVVDLGLAEDSPLSSALPPTGRRPGRLGGEPTRTGRVELDDGSGFELIDLDLRAHAPGSPAWRARLADTLDELVADGCQVLVHGPSVLDGPEVAEISRLVDGIVIAVRRHAPVADLVDGQRRLIGAATPTVGYVFLQPSTGRRLRRVGTPPRPAAPAPQRSNA